MVPASRIESCGRTPDGLGLLPDYVPEDEQRAILDWVDANTTWSFEFAGNPCETLTGTLPPWSLALAAAMAADGVFPEPPDYVHLIDYPAGSGVPAHVDDASLGETIAGVTLRSSRVLELTREGTDDRVRVLLMPGDLYVLEGEARHDWRHAVPVAAVDTFGGTDYERGAAVSVTFRRVAG